MRLGTYYRKELFKRIGIKTENEEKVLDVGCFDGYWLSTQEAKEKNAIDIDVDKKYQGINYKKGSALELPYFDGHFDQVFAFDVIEHIEEGQESKFITELVRVTKKGGKITLTTPSKDIKLFPFFLTNWVSKKWGHYKCNGYNQEEILSFIKNKDSLKIEMTDLNCQGYLRNYLGLRLLWILNKGIVKKILKRIVKKDSVKKGENGYILIKIKKKGKK